MVQGYYDLGEAAGILGISEDELRAMAKSRDVRAFADGGSWKFRQQDIQEVKRSREFGSEPDIAVGGSDFALGGDALADDDDATFVGDPGDESDVRLVVDDASGSGKGPAVSGKQPAEIAPLADDEDSDFGMGDSDFRMDDDSGIDLSTGDSDSGIGIADDSGIGIADDSGVDLAVGKGTADRHVSPAAEAAAAVGDDAVTMPKADGGTLDGGAAAAGASLSDDSGDDLDFNLDDLDSGFAIEGEESDFDLSNLAGDGSDSESGVDIVDLEGGSDSEILIADDGPASGIGLGSSPDDSGIPLDAQDEASESEFELSLDSDEDLFDSDDDMPAFKDDDEDDEPRAKPAAAAAVGATAGAAAAKRGKKPDTEDDSVSDSDFELEIEDEESGSEVVAIEEDEFDEFDDFDDEFDDQPVAVARGQHTKVVEARDPSWPAWVAAPLILNTILLALVGIMTFEIIRHSFSTEMEPYTVSGTVVGWFADMLGKP